MRAIAALLALGLLWAPKSNACRCASLTLAEYFDRADVAMQVRIDAVETVGDAHSRTRRRARFTLVQDYKHAAGVDALRSPVYGAQCGLSLQPGGRYWIFGSLAPGSTEIDTDLCKGSRAVDQAFSDTVPDDVHAVLLGHRRGLDCPAPAPAEIAARLQLDTAPRKDHAVASERSPNGAYGYNLENPPQVQGPPHIATLWIDREREHRLRLRMRGAAGAARAQWVNEKLVLVRVPWSLNLRSEIIVDVEASAILSVDSAQLDDAGRVRRWLDLACRPLSE